MKITLRARARAFLEKNGPSTIDQAVASLSKHITATQAIRAYDRSMIYSKDKVTYRKEIALSNKVKVGTRRIVRDTLLRVGKPTGNGTYKLAS